MLVGPLGQNFAVGSPWHTLTVSWALSFLFDSALMPHLPDGIPKMCIQKTFKIFSAIQALKGFWLINCVHFRLLLNLSTLHASKKESF